MRLEFRSYPPPLYEAFYYLFWLSGYSKHFDGSGWLAGGRDVVGGWMRGGETLFLPWAPLWKGERVFVLFLEYWRRKRGVFWISRDEAGIDGPCFRREVLSEAILKSGSQLVYICHVRLVEGDGRALSVVMDGCHSNIRELIHTQ